MQPCSLLGKEPARLFRRNVELGQAEDGFLLQLVQFWEEVVAVGQRLLPQSWCRLDHVKAGSSLCPLGSLDPKFNLILFQAGTGIFHQS